MLTNAEIVCAMSEVHGLPTREAVEFYNDLCKTEPVAGSFTRPASPSVRARFQPQRSHAIHNRLAPHHPAVELR